MKFYIKLQRHFMDSVHPIRDGRTKAARALRQEGVELWASATDEDLKQLSRIRSKRPGNKKSYSKLLTQNRKARAIHRKTLKDQKKRKK